MSYYFAIIGTQDNPLFEHEFGTSKQGGDGLSRFSDQARHLNQFILHSSLDVVEEVQWNNGQMYLKIIDKFFNNYISCFVTGANVKFLLLHQPIGSGTGASRSSTSIAANPTSAATEEAIKNFFVEVYENWVKAVMSPFYKVNMEVKSPIFRQRVVAAGKKYL
ncbi:TRAPP subunit [Gnomoniopsis sp. IMI 355080]|nr:TRAPP subunit [Gnomoniopsis sp. IMI 355080]